MLAVLVKALVDRVRALAAASVHAIDAYEEVEVQG